MNSTGIQTKKLTAPGVLVLIFLLLPIFSGALFGSMRNYIVLTAFNILMYAAMSSAWNIIGGFGRQVSWAHASFFAIGAYSGMIPLLRWNLSPWIGMLIGALISVVLAFIMGFASFRLRGVFFSLSTIACGQIVYRLLLYFSDLTGGASGLVMKKIQSTNLWMMQFVNSDVYYYIMLVLVVLVVGLCVLVEKSRLGYYLKAIREDEIAAESLGVRSHRIKLAAFMLSAAIMAIIGTIYAMRFKFLDPESVASHDLAIRIGMTVIIGGIGTIWGPVVGALISVPLLELTNAYFGSMLNGGLSQTLYGAILVIMVIFLPNGVVSTRELWKNAVVKRKEAKK